VNEPKLDRIMQVGTGFWASKTLLSAVELELFTRLAEGPADLQTLTARLGLHPRSARDFLDALVALGFLERSGGEYSNTAPPISFSTNASPPMSGECWRWRISAFIFFGTI
jgi:Dimerisation domain